MPASRHPRPASPDTSLAAILFDDALPGELEGLDPPARHSIANQVADALGQRRAGEPVVVLEPLAAEAGVPAHRRRMALIIVSDDRPFLVDSVAAAIAAAGLESLRLLHPVVDVRRSEDGSLIDITGLAAGALAPGSVRESVIYFELARANARHRAELVTTLQGVLADIAAAVSDWQAMLGRLRQTARALTENPPPVAPHRVHEAVAFLEWLAADNYTLLGVEHWSLAGDVTDPGFTPAREADSSLGLLRDAGFPLWGEGEAPGWPALIASPEPVLITKAGAISTVHRRTHADLISVKGYDAEGRVVSETRFLGLFTSAALGASPRHVPLLRRKVAEIVETLGFAPGSHSAKALLHVLENFPREELFEATSAQLKAMALGLLSLLDRPRPRLFARSDPFGRALSLLVYIPRESYTAGLRERITAMLAAETGGTPSRFEVELRSQGLARIHQVLTLPPGAGVHDVAAEARLDEALRRLVRGWDEGLEAALIEAAGATRAARLSLSHGLNFSPSYRAQHTPEEAAADIMALALLHDENDRGVRLVRTAGDQPQQLRLKVYRLGRIIPLSEAVPVLENFGLKVIEEFPFDLAGGRLGWIHDFLLEVQSPDMLVDWAALETRLVPALTEVLRGGAENDLFNLPVLECSLTLEEAGWLRAWFRYLRQTGVTYGIATIVEALRRAPAITRRIIALFRTRFALGVDDRAAAEATLHEALLADLADVTSIDDDRILRGFIAIISACLRTNAFVPGGPEALAMKFDSAKVPGLPPPVPYREIWVHSPRVEGIHLRGGPIARGGLRWSDRRDDFRTEVLGLVKAQMVKNAVIVPTGAKGGFYAKQLPSPTDREAWLAEGTAAYRIFIRALLSLTDNLDPAGNPLPPTHVVCHDAPDPYLVVAADKGTATFSDIANAIAEDHGFWLGDAFASGGGKGYDHKAMGITARGAWISVERHFRELGLDAAIDPVRTIGVGDMSGDVFGNGMLLSSAIHLVAAFDHRHIFLDPAPDAAAGFAERQRLFALPRSSWDDYDRGLLSAGGGIFPRSLKSITLSPQVQAMLGTGVQAMAPNELINALLKARVDLLWFGGIGTYVKASTESHADAGDRASDAVRVDARQLGARVIGEGANLGLTQAARIEFAQAGGRINTDFIDNSAGVDCSDHEVNIKIALGAEVAAARLAPADRDVLLASMTDAVAALVLADNRLQAQALSLAETQGVAAVTRFHRLLQTLEATAGLDRRVEGLPDDATIQRRAAAGQSFTRPEFAILMAYAKMRLTAALSAPEAWPLLDDPALEPDLLAAFPAPMPERFAGAIRSHRLRRELVATKLANELVNRGGLAVAFELAEARNATLVEVATAFVVTRDLFGFRGLWDALDAPGLPAASQLALHLEGQIVLGTHMGDVLRYAAGEAPAALVATLTPAVERLSAGLDSLLGAEPRRRAAATAARLEALGAPAELADTLVRLEAVDGAIGIGLTASRHGLDDAALARAYTRLGAMTGLDWAHGAALTLQPGDPWEQLLQSSLAQGFESIRLSHLAALPGADPDSALTDWLASHEAPVARLAASIARARGSGVPTPAMLAHLANEARQLLC
ncbi:glutamate dehydrogenase [Polymorphobacter multimanifer]|uniref:Glutamate dehydrogenase n=1 Tax=Polymorphobacter multimanifer TaxID=1070431 RepID=A0A841L1M4_9SPHN|nr:glutamate dehydrogenase [Polymorphobacter multimanifer]